MAETLRNPDEAGQPDPEPLTKTVNAGILGGSFNERGSVKTPVLSESARLKSQKFSLGMPPVKGDFHPVRKIGVGSFGEVWLAEERVDGKAWRHVAIKFLNIDQSNAAAEIFGEVEKLSGVSHDRGIVGVHHVEVASDPPYFTMDYAPGGSLAQLLSCEGKLTLSHAEPMFRRLVEALKTLHTKGIIHCDLKPENVLLTEDGKPLVADFGQARVRGKGPANTGSWFYMAPEQMDEHSGNAETSCDIYALGAIIYKMLTGKEPRSTPQTHESLKGHMSVRAKLSKHREAILEAPKPTAHYEVPGIDQSLCRIIDRCLELEPSLRFSDGAAVLNAFERRDRFIARTPIIRRGMIATTSILVLLFLTLSLGLPWLLSEFRDTYVKESMARDANAALLAGNVVEDKLHDSLRLVQKWTGDDSLQGHFATKDKNKLGHQLLQLVNDHVGRKVSAQEDSLIRGASIYDHDGLYLCGVIVKNGKPELLPDDDDLGHLLWNWRGWFNGQSSDQTPRREAYSPLKQPTISAPYQGIVPESKDVELRLTFSGPISRDDSGNATDDGVLAITTRPEVMFGLVTERRLRQDGQISIFDHAGHAIMHEHFDGGNYSSQFKSIEHKQFPQRIGSDIKMLERPKDSVKQSVVNLYTELLRMNEDAKLRLKNASVRSENQTKSVSNTLPEIVSTSDFHDPIDKQIYLASYCYLPTSGWGVIVQHKYASALLLFQNLATSIAAIGWISYLSGLGIVAWLWRLVLRRRRREELLLDG